MHPCWAIFSKLTPAAAFEFPSDFKLLPEHCVRLHDAMAHHDKSPEVYELHRKSPFFPAKKKPKFDHLIIVNVFSINYWLMIVFGSRGALSLPRGEGREINQKLTRNISIIINLWIIMNNY